MSVRIGRGRRGKVMVGGGFVAVVALALGMVVAMSSAAPPLSIEGPAVLASAPTLAGNKLPDPQTRARNAWASVLASSSRWRISDSTLAGSSMDGLAAAAPCLAAVHDAPSVGSVEPAVPRALLSTTYASQAPPLFSV
jgi:hypothetical protein